MAGSVDVESSLTLPFPNGLLERKFVGDSIYRKEFQALGIMILTVFLGPCTMENMVSIVSWQEV